MKPYFLIILLLFIVSCNTSSELEKIYNCKTKKSSNLKTVVDVKKQFSIKLPKHWNTNLYFDTGQTSIYSADTTKELTKTILLDVSFIYAPVVFDDAFKKKTYLANYTNQLKETTAKELTILKKASYITIAKGTKKNYPYQISTIFIKLNNTNFILAKTEVYGDSLVKERFCKAFKLIDKIRLK